MSSCVSEISTGNTFCQVGIGSCSMMTSTYLTLSIRHLLLKLLTEMSFFPALLLLCFSIERYFGICFPLQSRVRRRRLLVYLIPVIFTWYHDLYFGPKSDVMIITAALCTTFLNWWSWLAMGSWTLRSLMTRCMPRYANVCRIGIADVCQGKIFSRFLLSLSNSQPDLQAVHGFLLHGPASPSRTDHIQHKGLLRHEKAQKVALVVLELYLLHFHFCFSFILWVNGAWNKFANKSLQAFAFSI